MDTVPQYAPICKPCVYCLIDPRDEEIRYVGRTIQPLRIRLQQHIDTSCRKKSLCSRSVWIRDLAREGLKPRALRLEQAEESILPEREGYWIATLLEGGCRLLNEQSHNVGGGKSYVVTWTNELIEQLGKVSDSTLACHLHVDRKTIEYKRKKLGIAPCFKMYSNNPETRGVHDNNPSLNKISRLKLSVVPMPELDEKLGKYPDRELAEEFGVHTQTIRLRRKKLNIARCPQQNFTIPAMGGWNKIDLPENVIDRLGKLPDYVLGNEIGVTKSVIARGRKERNIPDYAQQTNNATRFQSGEPHPRWDKASKRIVVPSEIIEKLGTVSDSSLATEYTIPKSAIARKRKELNIPDARSVIWKNYKTS